MQTNTQDVIPWDYCRKVSADNDAFFSENKEFLPKIYSKMLGMGHDPILLLVAMDQEKWCALLALLYKRLDNLFIIPETFTKSIPVFINNGYCDVYIPPKIDGLEMQSCIFGLEREWLISEFCWVKGIPPMFISLIKPDMAPAESFTIVVLASNGMCVKHMPLNTIVTEQKAKPSAKNSVLEEWDLYGINVYPDLTDTITIETIKKAIPDFDILSEDNERYEIARENNYKVIFYVLKKGGLSYVIINGEADVSFLSLKKGTPIETLIKLGWKNIDSINRMGIQAYTFKKEGYRAEIQVRINFNDTINEIHYIL
ncbi:MAG TPA: hypothetical protein VIK55_18870 [Paludibacter sp.]